MWNLKLLGIGALVALSACAGSAWYAYSKGKASGMQEVQTSWDSEKLTRAAAQAEEMMKAKQKQDALQALLSQQRKDHQREATRIANDYAAVLNSLHDRPEARGGGDAGVPDAAGTVSGCTGAGLSRPDAAFLAGIAADAARTQAALNACVSAYNQARQLTQSQP
jgi:hypothetical protein